MCWSSVELWCNAFDIQFRIFQDFWNILAAAAAVTAAAEAAASLQATATAAAAAAAAAAVPIADVALPQRWPSNPTCNWIWETASWFFLKMCPWSLAYLGTTVTPLSSRCTVSSGPGAICRLHARRSQRIPCLRMGVFLRSRSRHRPGASPSCRARVVGFLFRMQQKSLGFWGLASSHEFCPVLHWQVSSKCFQAIFLRQKVILWQKLCKSLRSANWQFSSSK